ncbi:VIT domain-containing protein [Sphingomonas sp. I4]
MLGTRGAGLCPDRRTGAAAQVANPVLTARANGIRDEAHARPLHLRRLDLSVEQRGGVVETTVTAAFANPEREQLEGDFRLTLPEGAVVTGYALDIGGRMVDGVLVDRPRAKAVYEARVRQRVDPGLAEVGADNVFRRGCFRSGRGPGGRSACASSPLSGPRAGACRWASTHRPRVGRCVSMRPAWRARRS